MNLKKCVDQEIGRIPKLYFYGVGRQASKYIFYTSFLILLIILLFRKGVGKKHKS